MRAYSPNWFLLLLLATSCKNTVEEGCRHFGGTAEGGSQTLLVETPRRADEYPAHWTRSFQVAKQGAYTEGFSDGIWETSLESRPEETPRFLWGLITRRGWTISPQIGRSLESQSWVETSSCFYSDEPIRLALHVLREQSGSLLMLNAMETPLDSSGGVTLRAEVLPEMTARWKEIGCSNWRPDEMPMRGEPISHSVALELIAADGIPVAQAGVGQRASFQLGGFAYTLTVERAHGGEGRRCGTARFMVYRNDFFKDETQP
jgi:hypothetical protein